MQDWLNWGNRLRALMDTWIVSQNARLSGAPFDHRTDVRSTMFGKLITVQTGTVLSFRHFCENLLRNDWWEKTVPHLSQSERERGFQSAESLLRIGYVTSLFSAVESSLRSIDRQVVNSANLAAPFGVLYSGMLNQLQLQQYVSFMDMFRHIRNTVHNNGVFVDRARRNIRVTYRNVAYDFEHMQPISFVGWDLLIAIAEDAWQMLEAIEASQPIQAAAAIHDEFVIGRSTPTATSQ